MPESVSTVDAILDGLREDTLSVHVNVCDYCGTPFHSHMMDPPPIHPPDCPAGTAYERSDAVRMIPLADAVAAVHAAADAVTKAKLCDCNDPEGCIVVERCGGLPCACRFDDDGAVVAECMRHKRDRVAAADARTQEIVEWLRSDPVEVVRVELADLIKAVAAADREAPDGER